MTPQEEVQTVWNGLHALLNHYRRVAGQQPGVMGLDREALSVVALADVKAWAAGEDMDVVVVDVHHQEEGTP